MAQGYEVRSHTYMRTTVLVLARTGASDFLEKMRHSGKQSQKLRLILETMEIISERGIERCIGRSNFIRMIAPDLGLAEVKVSGKVIRIMTYVASINGEMKAVLLFDFTAHGGKTGKIPPNIIKRGRELAAIAKECVEEAD